MTRRMLLMAAGWLGAAVLAVLAGLAGISVIGAGLMSPDTTPRSAADVERELAALPSTEPRATSSLGPSPSANGTERSFLTAGGTVVIRCAGGLAEIRSISPAQGYGVHEADRGPRDEAEGEFRGISDGHDRVKIRAVCAGGTPSLSTRVEN